MMKLKKIQERIQDKFREYIPISTEIRDFIKSKNLSLTQIGLIFVTDKLDEFQVSDLLQLYTTGFSLLGQTYTHTPKVMGNEVTRLTQKGYIYLLRREGRNNILRISASGISLLSEFSELMDKKLKDKQMMPLDTIINEAIYEYVRNDLHKEIAATAEKYPDESSIYIDFLDIEKKHPEIADKLLTEPDDILSKFLDQVMDRNIAVNSGDEFRPVIRLKNLPDNYKITIAQLRARYLRRLCKFEGMVTEIEKVHPKIKIGVFACNKCGQKHEVPQPNRFLTEPISCDSCKMRDFRLMTNESISEGDIQFISLQESMESISDGRQPKHMNAVLEDDICDFAEPGERVIVTGILKMLPPKKKGSVYESFFHIISIEKTDLYLDLLNITKQEKKEIIQLSKSPTLYQDITDSIAPQIHGYADVKEACMLHLFGGRRGHCDSQGVPLRGDSHLLLIGEPGVAKSKIMDCVALLTPRCVTSTGKGSSGVGLTAVVVKSTLTGDYVLKAGSLVVANDDFFLVDEFDKMRPEDLDHLHSALEQQYIDINKGGIRARLFTRAAVLATANPKFGRFDKYAPIPKQFDIPPTILSRFDLIYVFYDIQDEKKDKRIADIIIRNRSIDPNHPKKDKSLDAKIPRKTLRRYIAYARANIHPIMSEAVGSALSDAYVALRRSSNGDSIAITPRQLEALIRLSEASAKVRLSNKVTEDDVQNAIKLYTNSIADIATDPETGEIDMDLIVTSHSHSARQDIQTVEKLIELHSMKTGDVSIDTILRKAQDLGINNDKCREIIQELKKKAIINELTHNILKPNK